MKHSSSFLSLALALLSVPFQADARNVFVFPSTGSGTVAVYDTNLGAPVTINAPSTAFQAFSDPVGNSYMVVSSTSDQAVNFYPKPLGSSSPSTVGLPQAPTLGAILPDGTRLLVVGSTNMYIIDTVSQAVITTIQVGAGPHSMAVSNDSKTAYVLSVGSDTLFPIDLVNNRKGDPITLQATSAVSVAPTGLVYVSTTNQILEYDPITLAIRGSINTNFKAGKLAFTADGKVAMVSNLSTGSSVAALDLVGRSVTGSITVGNGAAPEQLAMLTPNKAVGYSPRTQRIYEMFLPQFTVQEVQYQPAGAILSMVISDEIPTRFIYFTTADRVYRADAAASSGLADVFATGGPVSYAGPASIGPVVTGLSINDNQTVTGSAAFFPIAIRLLDTENRPIYGTSVTFSSLTTGVTVQKRNDVTGTNGLAIATVSAPANAGAITITASIPGFTRSFTLTSGTGGGGGGGGGGCPPNCGSSTFTKVSGDGQIFIIGLPNPSTPMVVQFLNASGVPLSNQTVTWTASNGGSVFAASQTTNDKGQAQATFFGGGVSIGFGTNYVQSIITATAPTGQTASFTFTVLPAGSFPPTINVFPEAGNRALTAKAGSTTAKAITYIASTGGGANGVQGGIALPGIGMEVSTNFTADKGPTAACRTGTVFTDAAGQGSCDLIAGGKIGSAVDMTALIGGSFPVSFTLTVTPGDPAAPTIVQGNNQVLNSGATTPNALVIQIADAFGNVVGGAPVTWEVVTAGTLTLVNSFQQADSNGRASTLVRAGNTPGTFQVRATSGSGNILFNVIVNASLGSLAPVSGQDNPAVLVGTAFPQPLVVQVNDTTARPVQGVTVTWAATNGSVSSPTSTTDANGRASITATAGNTAGAVTITAAVAGLPNVSFSLQARLPGPVLSAAAFTNFATGEAGVVKGGLVLIRAQGVAPVTGAVNANLLSGRLPLTLGDVTVQFDSIYAPIYQVANINGVESVLVQAPFELSGSTTTVIVTVKSVPATIAGIPVTTYGPGVLEEVDNAGRRYAIAIRSDGYRVTQQTPARRGERIRIYSIGLGQTNPAASTNTLGSPIQNVLVPVTVGLSNAGVSVISAKMADNLVGVYEVIFQVPADATTGDSIPLGFFIEATPGVPTFANGSAIPIAAQ